MSPNNFLHICVTETCSIYRIGITRLGVCHVVDGLVAVLIGAALMWMNQGTIWSGIGVWTGLPMMMAGVVCFMSRQRKHRGAISGVTIVALIVMMASSFLFASSAYNVRDMATAINITDHFPQYKLTDKAPLILSNSFLMLFGFVEIVVCVWSITISVGMVCLCCPAGKDQVFTIPYEGMENEGPVGPDIVQAPVRQRHTNNSSSAFMEELDDAGVTPFTDAHPGGRVGGGGGGGVRGGGGAGGRLSNPPVLQIDMDLEWDEMMSPVGGDEIDQSVMGDADDFLGLRSSR